MTRLTASKSGSLKGTLRVPSDKSMSHRALMFGAVATGVTRIDSLLEAGDVLSTASALRAFGIEIERKGGQWTVHGAPWRTPDRALDFGNAGTGSRLMMGLAAGQGVSCTIVGDPSLSRRPMGRVLNPLREMGLKADDHDGKLPVTLHPSRISGFSYAPPMASAQVKSAVLLAGLGATGPVTVTEKTATRDHTERMLTAFGAEVSVDGLAVTLRPKPRLVGQTLNIPADPSSAAFPTVAALIREGSEVRLPEVMLNARRTGLFKTLRRMGADITEENRRTIGGEEVADLLVRGSKLKAVHVPAEDVPDMIDEIPILSVAAACAEGTTRIEGLEELKVKESDRLAATARILTAAGVTCRTGEDWLEIDGAKSIPGGGTVATDHDHRIGMATLVLGLASEAPMIAEDAESIGTSFPDFHGKLAGLGANVGPA
ncbi:3-phosphoshikimate 1-carboxyvinyltransferase [Parvularcula sp. ZS-1/3]|uniref:3-phosphoshikimate 1-carboxyvinyltransferase n=1 Tax=Parvularcula mediterranea TaxID=2732508 RepID=A0A7Y3RJD6_9PROT|nr:3-phosphoshikimate 1-carboxyvinyltransferase [Parvularcula mediterranea]NNU15164.1 3-phosphoshikimate 1-carboxyvinyltransferase [Parvularcula mediterranea]